MFLCLPSLRTLVRPSDVYVCVCACVCGSVSVCRPYRRGSCHCCAAAAVQCACTKRGHARDVRCTLLDMALLPMAVVTIPRRRTASGSFKVSCFAVVKVRGCMVSPHRADFSTHRIKLTLQLIWEIPKLVHFP